MLPLQVAPACWPLYDQVVLWPVISSVTFVAVTLFTDSVTEPGVAASDSGDAVPSPFSFTARTLNL